MKLLPLYQRRGLGTGTYITSNQAYLDAIADELNDRPRASLGFYTPREKFEALPRSRCCFDPLTTARSTS